MLSGVALLNFGLSSLFDIVLFGKEMVLCFIFLFILAIVGNTVFYLEKKFPDIQFPQAFMIVTTLQLLGAMSFSAFLRYTLESNMQTIMIQFVIAFLIFVAFQAGYLINTKAGDDINKG
jgi:hypothetical protein